MVEHVEEKEFKSSDPIGSSPNDTRTTEPVNTEPLQYVVSDSDSSTSEKEKQPRRNLGRTITERTTSTAAPSTFSSSGDGTRCADEKREKKAWYKRLNPLKRSQKPPVPKDREVSKEYGASFFSILTFQWMSPLMRVRGLTSIYEN